MILILQIHFQQMQMNTNLIDTITDLRHNKNRKENYKNKTSRLYSYIQSVTAISHWISWSWSDWQSKVQWKNSAVQRLDYMYIHVFLYKNFQKSQILANPFIGLLDWFCTYLQVILTCQRLLHSTALWLAPLLKLMMIVGQTPSE